MKERNVIKTVQGAPAIDGAGVHLVRVLGHNTVKDYDPFLMLDSFDSRNPADYVKGFPTHPHRGIETVTYLAKGNIVHEDSLGNRGTIVDGGTQWMTAGSGILHSEMPQPAERMLGVQLWLNLPAKDKMTTPKYFDILAEDVPLVEKEDYTLRVIAGEFQGVRGATPHHLQATYYDIELAPEKEILVPTKEGETVFVFLLEGDALVGGKLYREKSAVLFDEEGDVIRLQAGAKPAKILFLQAPKLKEEVAWGGPIVMNTREDLQEAFNALRRGDFIQEQPR